MGNWYFKGQGRGNVLYNQCNCPGALIIVLSRGEGICQAETLHRTGRCPLEREERPQTSLTGLQSLLLDILIPLIQSILLWVKLYLRSRIVSTAWNRNDLLGSYKIDLI